MAPLNTAVVLITDDPALADAVARQRPLGVRLRTLRGRDVEHGALPRAGQLWIDLDSFSGAIPDAGIKRVYFHSAAAPDGDARPAGLYLRKPCNRAALDVLWAGASPVRVGETEPTCATLPGWVLQYQELNLRLLCRRLVTDLPVRLGYAEVSLYLHDESHGVLTLAETSHARPIDLTVPLTSDQHLMALVAREGGTLCSGHTASERVTRGLTPHADHAYDDGQCLIAPLHGGERLVGVLNFSGVHVTRQTEVGLALPSVFAFVARALHHALVYDQARTEARVDSLTGLYNLRWMREALDKEIRRAQRFTTPLALLMLDLDELKRINDQQGHAAGDALLRHVAGRIGAILRQFDGAARVGGDEFVVMLPATNLGGARQVAQRLLQSIRADSALHAGQPLHITASIGVAEWQPSWDAEQLLAAADRALYCAKSQGRDRLICDEASGAVRLGTPAGPPPTSPPARGARHAAARGPSTSAGASPVGKPRP
jgi:diguanylate cyclase (GGDEF)-like protein